MSIFVIIDIIVTCFECWLILFLLSDEEKQDNRIGRIILFLSQAISISLMTYFDWDYLNKMLVAMGLTVLIGSFAYKCSRYKLLMYSLLWTFSVILSEEIVIAAWNLYNKPIYSDNIIYKDFVLSLVIAVKAFHFFLVVLFRKILQRNKENRTLKEIVPFLCIGIPFLLLFEYLSLNMPVDKSKDIKIFYLICCMGILFAFIFILMFFERYLTMSKKAQQDEVALYELDLKYGYYLKRQEDEGKVREIYHDLKNHLLLLQEDEIINKLKKKIEGYESYVETGNEFLNIIISEKIKAAQTKGIRMECNIDFSKGYYIDPIDISTIFGNLLDNAVEAAGQVVDSEKYILVNARPKGSFMVIIIRNSMKTGDSKSVLTTKKNRSFHGYGLPNIKKVVKDYGGEYSIRKRGEEFSISILLPIN